jgi:hypothetical protein
MSVGKKTGGRQLGSVNKATADARQAIASFVDGNAHRLTEWLDRVAEGVKVEDPETGEEKYIVAPNPAKAFDMFQSVVEYHIPKLARTEVTGSDTQPVIVEHNINVFGQLLENIKASRQSQ